MRYMCTLTFGDIARPGTTALKVVTAVITRIPQVGHCAVDRHT